MRYRYPIGSEELQDEFRKIYEDSVFLLGYTDPSGFVKSSGIYDIIDLDVDSSMAEYLSRTRSSPDPTGTILPSSSGYIYLTQRKSYILNMFNGGQ